MRLPGCDFTTFGGKPRIAAMRMLRHSILKQAKASYHSRSAADLPETSLQSAIVSSRVPMPANGVIPWAIVWASSLWSHHPRSCRAPPTIYFLIERVRSAGVASTSQPYFE